MFDGFERSTSCEGIEYVRAGAGSPLLLLHGFPETHACWHRAAPRLARRFTVIAADLPGYGDSRPASDGSKREMGAALVRFMRQLGWQRFALVGHDRGARVAYRMALDSPRRVSHLAVLDIVPTLEVAQAMSYRLAFEMVNWFLLAQPHPFPETLIGADPGFYVNRILDAWAAKGDAISDQARARYVRQFEAPAVRRAVCDEYRAAAGIDLEHDRADHAAGRRIEAPLLVLWSAHDIAGQHFDPIAVWRRWAVQVSGRALDCGHFLMEQAAEPVCEEIEAFLLRGSAPPGA